MADSIDIPADLLARYKAAGQEHVFKFAQEGKISNEEAAALFAELEALNIERVNELYNATVAEVKGEEEVLEPVPEITALGTASEEDCSKWSTACFEAMSRGEVAVILLAGGQGTRLGFDRPKGEYVLATPSYKTLFRLQAERLLRLCDMAKAATGAAEVHLPWYVMTSPMTDEATRSHFQEVGFYGVPQEDVFFFQQGTLPCMTAEGKVMLETGSSLARAPDGNGGIYMGLHTSGAAADMAARGVQSVFVYAVDNAAVRVCDPLFVGYSIAKGADVGVKVTPKASAGEKVGVLCMKGGRPAVVEYSDIDPAVAAETTEDGSLRLNAGSICIHYYSLDFLTKTCSVDNLPKVYHLARKAIPYAHPDTGATIAKGDLPPGPTGIKLESFIFDVFPFSTQLAVVSCTRSEEFSPVKNAPGNPVDSPDSARAILSNLHKGWLTAAGATLTGQGMAEVSPLVSYSGEGLEALAGASLQLPVHVYLASETLPADAAAQGGATTTQELTDASGRTVIVASSSAAASE